jgi:hypothetical protein
MNASNRQPTAKWHFRLNKFFRQPTMPLAHQTTIDACKEWRKKTAADNTWATFKTFFAAEYHDMKEQQKVNESQNNFHGADAVTNISTALDNLAMAATTDCDSGRATNNSLKPTKSSLSNFEHPSKPTVFSPRNLVARNHHKLQLRHHREDEYHSIVKPGKPTLIQMDIVGRMGITLRKAIQVQTAKANLEAIRTTPHTVTIKEAPPKTKSDK